MPNITLSPQVTPASIVATPNHPLVNQIAANKSSNYNTKFFKSGRKINQSDTSKHPVPKHRTPCPFLKRGFCKKSPFCGFLHNNPQLHTSTPSHNLMGHNSMGHATPLFLPQSNYTPFSMNPSYFPLFGNQLTTMHPNLSSSTPIDVTLNKSHGTQLHKNYYYIILY